MKIKFLTLENMLEWLRGREAKYEIYVETDTKTSVAMPMVSTRPIKIGASPFKESANKTIDEIKRVLPDIEGRIYTVDSIDYQIAER